jgi:hypothetical protein
VTGPSPPTPPPPPPPLPTPLPTPPPAPTSPGGVYGTRRGGPDILLLVALAVLVLGVGTGVILALQSLGGPDDPVTSASFEAVRSSGPPAPVAPSSGTPTPSAPPAPAAQQFTAVRGLGSQLCLDTAPDEPGAGGRLIVAACAATPGQRWQVTATAGLVNGATGLCAAVSGGAQDDRARVQQEPCAASPNQQWRISPAEGGTAAFVVQHSGKCLDVAGGASAPGTQVWQYTCNGTPAQRWTLQPA